LDLQNPFDFEKEERAKMKKKKKQNEKEFLLGLESSRIL
jgi:hypothetical protein